MTTEGSGVASFLVEGPLAWQVLSTRVAGGSHCQRALPPEGWEGACPQCPHQGSMETASLLRGRVDASPHLVLVKDPAPEKRGKGHFWPGRVQVPCPGGAFLPTEPLPRA